MKLPNEIWKDVHGYEGYYQVSNMGRVCSIDRNVTRSDGTTRLIRGKMIRPTHTNKGQHYPVVNLCVNGKTQMHLVHRLVAQAFLGPIPEGMEVDHINENGQDNRVENLRYLSRHENASRSTKGFFRKESNAMENNPRSKVVLGFLSGELVERISCAKYLTKEFGINYSTLRHRLQNGGVQLGNKFYCYETSN
jgi:hypothetical protein